jgi:hypothetical protein
VTGLAPKAKPTLSTQRDMLFVLYPRLVNYLLLLRMARNVFLKFSDTIRDSGEENDEA